MPSTKAKPILKEVKPTEEKQVCERCSNCGTYPKADEDKLGYKQVYCPNCLRWECMKYPNELTAINAWNEANKKNEG